MGRVNRTSLPDGYFHLVSRGVCGTEVFTDDEDRRGFLQLLRSTEQHFGWRCHAFCLMTTHYHLVVETTRENLSRGLHRVNGRYALRFNHRHGRYGHLFAERFSARVIADETYLYDACAYVVLNPVKIGLCEQVGDWPWSFSRFGLE
jgi:REP element-mobilizing transposase RayT